MGEFNKYFSVYESVEPPQIIGIHSLDYNPSSDNLDLPSTDNYKWKSPFGLTTTPLQDTQPTDNTIQSDIVNLASELQKEGVEIGSLADVEEGDLIFTSNPNSSSNYIIRYFINKGLTKNQAKGIYGNLMQESGGNLRAVSKDGHNSYGLAQWTGSRKTKLFSMYGRNPSLKQQLDFLWWELNNTHTDALQALKSTNTVSGATRVFMDKFERPHKRYQYFNRRLKYANSIV